jgi:hypothetical protein
MKRFRLSTLMLLVVIAAQATALVVQQLQISRREAAMQAQISALRATSMNMQKVAYLARIEAAKAQAQAAVARAEFLSGQKERNAGHQTGDKSP